MKPTMLIAGLQKLAVNNYPKELGCVIFTKGCNFRCPWCKESSAVLPDQENVDSGDHRLEPLTLGRLFDFLRQKKNVLRACTIGGGEPTIHDDLPNLCSEIKRLGYLIKLDTNGSNYGMLELLISEKLIDFVSVDIKAPKEKYGEMIGFSDCAVNYLFNQLEQTVKLVKSAAIGYEFTTTAAPLLYKKDILAIAHWIRPARKYVLQVFRPQNTIQPRFADLGAYSLKYLAGIQRALEPFFDVCEVR